MGFITKLLKSMKTEHLKGENLRTDDPEWRKTPDFVKNARIGNANEREIAMLEHKHALERQAAYEANLKHEEEIRLAKEEERRYLAAIKQKKQEQYLKFRIGYDELIQMLSNGDWLLKHNKNRLVLTFPPLKNLTNPEQFPDYERRIEFCKKIFATNFASELGTDKNITDDAYKIAALYAAFTDFDKDKKYFSGYENFLDYYPINDNNELLKCIRNILGTEHTFNVNDTSGHLAYMLIKGCHYCDPFYFLNGYLDISYTSDERINNIIKFWSIYQESDIAPYINTPYNVYNPVKIDSNHIWDMINKAKEEAKEIENLRQIYKKYYVNSDVYNLNSPYIGADLVFCRAIPENGIVLYLTAKNKEDYIKLIENVMPDILTCNMTYLIPDAYFAITKSLPAMDAIYFNNQWDSHEYQIILIPDACNAKEFFKRHPELTDSLDGQPPTACFGYDYYTHQMEHVDKDTRYNNQLSPVHLGGCVYGQYFQFYEDAYVKESQGHRFIHTPYKPIKPSIDAFINYCNRDYPSMFIAHLSGLYVDYVYGDGRFELYDPDFDNEMHQILSKYETNNDIPRLKLKDIPYCDNPMKYEISWKDPTCTDCAASINWLQKNNISAPNFVKTFYNEASSYFYSLKSLVTAEDRRIQCGPNTWRTEQKCVHFKGDWGLGYRGYPLRLNENSESNYDILKELVNRGVTHSYQHTAMTEYETFEPYQEPINSYSEQKQNNYIEDNHIEEDKLYEYDSISYDDIIICDENDDIDIVD